MTTDCDRLQFWSHQEAGGSGEDMVESVKDRLTQSTLSQRYACTKYLYLLVVLWLNTSVCPHIYMYTHFGSMSETCVLFFHMEHLAFV